MSSLTDHYDALRAEFDYDDPACDVGPIDGTLVDRAFAATTDQDALREAAERDTLFVASAGLTGTPHVGTLAQMYAVKRFSEAGFDTQFLIADYEKYAGGGRDLDVVRGLADDYRSFLDAIGYEGGVRTQYGATDVMQTAFRLGRYFEFESDLEFDVEPTTWVQNLRAAYEADGIDHDDAGERTEFGARLTGLLCLADFVHPTLADGYDQTVFLLGVDEHALVLANEHYLDGTPFDADFEGLFTRIVPGLDGYPKMSKTIPGSGIRMDMHPEDVRRLVHEAADDDAPPAESTVFQMQCLVSEYDADRLTELAAACRRGCEAWDAAVTEYADFLAGLAAAWPDS
jgi:tryptophanyl-tRNA synthetase